LDGGLDGGAEAVGSREVGRLGAEEGARDVPAGLAAGEALNGLGHERKADGVGRDVHFGQMLRRDEGDAAGLGAQVGGIDEKDARAAGRDDGNEETFGDGLDVEEPQGGARFEGGDDGGTEGVVAAKGVSDADDGEGRRQGSAQGGGEPSGGVAEIEGGLGHF
jgi:hypothetical protein